MGNNQATSQTLTVQDLDGKKSMLPVVLPSHMIHSSSSHSTLTSDDSVSSSGSVVTDQDMMKALLSSYDCKAIIGKGSSGQVFEVVHKITGEKFACKIVHKNFMINDEGTMTTETEIMKRTRHSNVVRLHELFETSASKWFILEHANAGTLQMALASEPNYVEHVVAGAFKQALKGVQYLHYLGIVHRDLKQDNILCSVSTSPSGDRSYHVKIADFGLSTILNAELSRSVNKSKRFNKLKDMWGTKEYFAPEVYKKAYGPQVDVWSLGCVLYELLTGAAPFPVRERQVSAVKKVLLYGGRKIQRGFTQLPAFRELSREARDLICKMLKVDPRKRYSIDECLAHPWLNGELLNEPRSSRSNSGAVAARVIPARMAGGKGLEGDASSFNVDRESGMILHNARLAAEKQVERQERKLKVLAKQLELDAMRAH